MKASKYNIFVPYKPDEVYIAYNAVSNGFYVFNAQQFLLVKNILDTGGNSGKSSTDLLKDSLEKGWFLIDDHVDELKLLKLRNNISRFNPDGTALIIAPTLLCPLACRYCYVDRDKTAVDRATIEALKKFFLNKIERSNNAVVCRTKDVTGLMDINLGI